MPTGTRRFYIFTVTDRKSLPKQTLRRRSFQAAVPEIRLQTSPDAVRGLSDSRSALCYDTAWPTPASPQEAGGPRSSRKDVAPSGVDIEADHSGREVLR